MRNTTQCVPEITETMSMPVLGFVQGMLCTQSLQFLLACMICDWSGRLSPPSRAPKSAALCSVCIVLKHSHVFALPQVGSVCRYRRYLSELTPESNPSQVTSQVQPDLQPGTRPTINIVPTPEHVGGQREADKLEWFPDAQKRNTRLAWCRYCCCRSLGFVIVVCQRQEIRWDALVPRLQRHLQRERRCI